MQISRRGTVDAFIVMDVVARAAALEAQGRDIVHFEIGQPSTSAPPAARDRLKAAMDADALGYSVSLGRPDLREGIAGLYKTWYGIDLDPGRIVITSGSSGAFLLAFTALFETGARVGIGAPSYPSYRQILRSLDMVCVDFPTSAENRYQPVPGDLPEGLDGLLIASPGNPSGTMIDGPGMEALVETVAERGISLISDEIYHGLHYEARATSALEITDDVYVINSFSKYFSMTGWRIGWMVVPEAHVRAVERVMQSMFICAPHASQVLASAALGSLDALEGYRATYIRNRALMLEGLPEAGFTRLAPPDGAFYIYADVSHITEDSRALADELLEEAGVAVTTGLDFDPARGHQTLRFSYATKTDAIREGLRRLKAHMARR